MKGNEFKNTMISNINRLNGEEERGVTAFYRGAITALLNCGLMTDSEFWHYSKKLTNIELNRQAKQATIDWDVLRQLINDEIDKRCEQNGQSEL